MLATTINIILVILKIICIKGMLITVNNTNNTYKHINQHNTVVVDTYNINTVSNLKNALYTFIDYVVMENIIPYTLMVIAMSMK